ncbi:MAG: di-trans,poly-cis-decaprenylcistransferase [Halothiobacillaceae bacterium]|nr:di-trans,poly-cis-decaprenylcistransferase [Halothiobacillaceae bacterium]HER34008.1 di-trans,poly-cis-decaprenylcistransferase [Halothiobacillaceae bacterium]
MDGNGRWARARHLPRTVGHQRGRRAVRATIRAAMQNGVGILTLFAFSSENWKRPADEVDALMKLFIHALEKELDELDDNGVRLVFIGERDRLDPEVRTLMESAEHRTAENHRLLLQVAVSYGGHWDILQAARRLAERHAEAPIALDDPAALCAAFEVGLSTGDQPPVDLFIRTGGERRLSNFLLWQMAYAELYFTEVLWPAFDETEFARAIDWYAKRERRFGRVDPGGRS